jgi:uncharacterized damage-inducible protein DinB
LTEPWLRGPVAGVPPLLQPAAHAFLMAREDITAALDGITEDELWLEPHGVAALGFHLAHLSGSTDRLLTYARGEALSANQRATLDRERALTDERSQLHRLLAEWHETVAAALRQLSSTSEADLQSPRAVGRARLPSTVLGLLFHAAEHASRHTGQIVTTAKLIRANR